MKAGFVSVDITPAVGVPIGGNVRDEFASKGVHDPLKADIIVFSNGCNTVAFVDLDWVCAELYIIRDIKKAIEKKADISCRDICISVTHTHSGPDVYPVTREPGISESTGKYIADASARIAEGVKEASENMEDVLVGFGKGLEYEISFNRRILLKDGNLHMNWKFKEDNNLKVEDVEKAEGPIDPEINVVKICSANGSLKAVIINFALHPAVLVGLDFLFSKDFILGLEKELNETYGEGILIYYANGAQGNINHIDIYNESQGRDWNEAERIGRILGRDVRGILQQTEVENIDKLDVSYKDLSLSIRNITEKEKKWAVELWNSCGGKVQSLFDGVPDEWYAGNLLKMIREGKTAEVVELQVIRMGSAVIATLPGEVFTEYGLKLKKASPFKNTLVFGISNQCAGYFPTPEAIKNGGMEGKTCHFSRFAPEAGDVIINELLKMINSFCIAGNNGGMGNLYEDNSL
jgi:neutral ceramidase